MKNFLWIPALVLLAGCKKETNSQSGTAEVPIPTAVTQTVQTQCYLSVLQKDSITLKVVRTGNKVAGDLRFKNFEKDSSTGPVEGRVAGDTLKLTYTFQSEGSKSVREIYFLQQGEALLMGTGDMEDQGGKMVFTKPQSVQYTAGITLQKTDCK